jgi:alkylation response protein AidB-like acyl-CoA dehydrogenase
MMAGDPKGSRIEKYYRDASMGQIAEGTIRIVKLVMGRRLLAISAVV